jgi:hypothetical protein
MLKYLNLNSLQVESISTDENIITKGVNIIIKENCAISTLNSIIGGAVKKLLMDLEEDKIYNFAFDILTENDTGLEIEEFESAVHCILSNFFSVLIGKLALGRPRERRLDVPEDIKKQVNCNMSLVKRAINYKTLVDRFQLTIYSRTLKYKLVGDYSE